MPENACKESLVGGALDRVALLAPTYFLDLTDFAFAFRSITIVVIIITTTAATATTARCRKRHQPKEGVSVMGKGPVVLAVLALAACEDSLVLESPPAYAVYSYTLAPNHVVIGVGDWVGTGLRSSHGRVVGVVNDTPDAVECRPGGTQGYLDCDEMAEHDWMLLTEEEAGPVLDVLRPLDEDCGEIDCVTLETIRRTYDPETVRAIVPGPPVNPILRYGEVSDGLYSAWGYEALRCGTAWIGQAKSVTAVVGGRRIVFPEHAVFTDTVWVTVTGC